MDLLKILKHKAAKSGEIEFTCQLKVWRGLENISEAELLEELKKEIVRSILSDLTWREEWKEQVSKMIDWEKLTPIIQALATKELAEKVFSGMRR